MSTSAGQDRTALVVEDDEDMRSLIELTLSTQGFDVMAVESGLDGVEAVRNHNPDLVTLDLGLPGIDGIEACRRIREISDAYVVMITSRDDEVERLIGLETGADDFLSKPFSYLVLVARLRALVRRGTVPRRAVLCVDDIELDPAARKCRRAGRDVALTPRELALLEVLMRYRGEVLSKDKLLDEVWGADFEGAANVVEVYIGYLRRKLDVPFGRSSLETLRGVGYRLKGAHDG